MSSFMKPAIVTVITVAALITGCRDGIAPFSPDAREPLDGDTYQLTFGRYGDFAPSWSINSDTVFYSTDRFYDQPAIGATLLRIARPGGVAQLLAPGSVSADTFPRVVLPVPSPNRQRIAYVHIPFIRAAAVCGETLLCTGTQPLIERGFVRVRDAGSTVPANLDMATPVAFPGRNPGVLNNTGTVENFTQQLYPFQQRFVERGEFLFRPSWSPDAQRIVFSDGLSLWIWDLVANTSAQVTGTLDGVNAAWSPSAQRIAFTRLVRGDSTSVRCSCQDPAGSNTEPHTRWFFPVVRAVITLIDPDGGNSAELVEGEDPAWSPDGAFIYYAADNRINRIPAAGGVAEPVPGTMGGRAPAVSPDGNWLAFTRTGSTLRNSDIWITRLASQ